MVSSHSIKRLFHITILVSIVTSLLVDTIVVLIPLPVGYITIFIQVLSVGQEQDPENMWFHIDSLAEVLQSQHGEFLP